MSDLSSSFGEWNTTEMGVGGKFTRPESTVVGSWMINQITDVNFQSSQYFPDDTVSNNTNVNLLDGNISGTSSNSTGIPNNIVNISAVVPPEFGVPIYGYLVPAVIVTTMLTNSFIVVVLSRPQLRSPTNCLLLAISVTECLTGLVSLPWFLYYYTFQGYKKEIRDGFPAFWCRSFMYFSDIVPTIMHTAAIWLTVYLAIQRYVYVSRPTGVNFNFGRIFAVIGVILICSVLLEMPMILGRYTLPIVLNEKLICTFQTSYWVNNYVFAAHYWLFAILVHAGPCALLVAFTGLLICTLNKAVYRRQRSLGFSGGGSALRATTKMLVVIIIMFLITEIPAAVVFILHVLIVTFGILSFESYRTMNLALILRNVFILVSYPFKFAVYLSMSNQFRTTVINLFCPKYATPIPKHSVASFNFHRKKDPSVEFSTGNGYNAQPEQIDLLPLAQKIDEEF